MNKRFLDAVPDLDVIYNLIDNIDEQLDSVGSVSNFHCVFRPSTGSPTTRTVAGRASPLPRLRPLTCLMHRFPWWTRRRCWSTSSTPSSTTTRHSRTSASSSSPRPQPASSFVCLKGKEKFDSARGLDIAGHAGGTRSRGVQCLWERYDSH